MTDPAAEAARSVAVTLAPDLGALPRWWLRRSSASPGTRKSNRRRRAPLGRRRLALAVLPPRASFLAEQAESNEVMTLPCNNATSRNKRWSAVSGSASLERV